jgi:hypothetical protein
LLRANALEATSEQSCASVIKAFSFNAGVNHGRMIFLTFGAREDLTRNQQRKGTMLEGFFRVQGNHPW